MGFEKIRSIRPLTKQMLDLLKDCHHREKHDMDSQAVFDPELIKGLMERGLLEAGQDNSRQYIVTTLGKEYIKHYFGD